MPDDELDLSDVVFNLSGQELVNALKPYLLKSILSDQTFATQLCQILLPPLRTALLQAARNTGNSLGPYAGS